MVRPDTADDPLSVFFSTFEATEIIGSHFRYSAEPRRWKRLYDFNDFAGRIGFRQIRDFEKKYAGLLEIEMAAS